MLRAPRACRLEGVAIHLGVELLQLLHRRQLVRRQHILVNKILGYVPWFFPRIQSFRISRRVLAVALETMLCSAGFRGPLS